MRPHRRWLPYLLLLPGVLWLLLFFAVPAMQLFAVSLYDPAGSIERGYAMTWRIANYADALRQYSGHFGRSFGYAAVAAVLALLLGYPLAYAIARAPGRWRSVLLVAVVAPFFTSFLVRTLAWKVILADTGPLVPLLTGLHAPLPEGRLLATAPAVVAGLVYNVLPFMVLPLFASLERLDPALLDAAGDLYAGPVARFRGVTLPLSLPGVLAGTLLTFISTAGDYINAQLLGTGRQYMIGNVIQSKFLRVGDHPAAAALSFLLMAAILAPVLVYLRRTGGRGVL